MSNEPGNQETNPSLLKFWTWFQENEEKLSQLERNQERIHEVLIQAFQQVAPGLVFEIGSGATGNRRELVLSANGNPEHIATIERLYAAAPELRYWRLIKFRPRSSQTVTLDFEGSSIPADQVRFQVFNDGDRIGILLLFAKYTEMERHKYVALGRTFLERLLGEYDLMTRVSFVDYAGSDSNLFPDARRLPELPMVFDEFFDSMKSDFSVTG